MRGFDVDNPPTDYKTFRKQIYETLEDAEVEIGDEYEQAFFIVDKDYEAEIFYSSEVMEEAGDENVNEVTLAKFIYPSFLASKDVKFFAFVFEATRTEEEIPIVVVLTGSTDLVVTDLDLEVKNWIVNPQGQEVWGELDLRYADLLDDEDWDIYELDTWNKQDPADYPEFVAPFRHATFGQNE